MTCPNCAGTGDKWDNEKEDWAPHGTYCEHCRGWGEIKDDGSPNTGKWYSER